MNEIIEVPFEMLASNNPFQVPIKDINTTEDEPEWTTTTTFYFLDEVLKKKKELHDPKHRCTKYYGEIRDILLDKWSLHFTIRDLEKKFHCLKRNFDILCVNRDRNGGAPKRPVNWPFFDKMMEIFAEELDIEDCPTMASLYPELPLPRTALPQKKDDSLGDCFTEDDQETANGEVEKTKQSMWTHKAVVDFLEECIERKDALWDPNIVRNEVFTEISEKLKKMGYTFTPDSLDCKLKNLKYSYKMRTSKSTGKRKHYPWPYFEQLHSLYNGYVNKKPSSNSGVKRRRSRRSRIGNNPGEDKKIKKEETIPSSDDLTTSKNFRKLLPKPDPFQQFHLPAPNASQTKTENLWNDNIVEIKCPISPGDLDYSALDDDNTIERLDDEILQSIERIDEETPTPKQNIQSTKKSLEDAKEEYEFAKKMLALEERRTIAIEKVLEELVKSNSIRERKLKFNQSKLLHLKTRAKRKQFVNKNLS
ncbi:uncharacterized protein LOC129914542 [Episyrphus balteatus]|uniref:uncharacterized protein LOC129914542 n=1 Tax=Episyrphus balteatus TaxID=286459 RepID=UPI002484EB89|nr:uncharacterized protein LOC129914542 [Episyrphus balteatus]